MKRFIAAKTITNAGTYYDRTGRWTVRDTQATGGFPTVFASGQESAMKRWARELNAR